MGIIFANNAGSTLDTSISDSTLSLVLVSGSLFPTFGGGEYTYVTLTDGVTYEIVKVTGKSYNTLTVAPAGRGLDGTIATAWPAGTLVQIRIPRITANELLTYAGTAATSEANAAASAAIAATYVPLDWEGAWLTATSYQVNDAVKEAGSSYVCLVAHTSGVFATDLAALKWDTIAEKGTDGAGIGDFLANGTVPMTAPLVHTAGTALLPSLTTTGDLNTGIYFPAADTVAVSTGGAERMRIASTGNVSIGTAIDHGRLSSFSADTGNQSFGQLYAVTTNTAAINVGGRIAFGGSYTGTTPTQWASISGCKESAVVGEYGAYLSFATRPQGGVTIERMRIDSSGITRLVQNAAYDSTPGDGTYALYFQEDSAGKAHIDAYSSGGSTLLSFGTNLGGGAIVEALKIDSSQNVLVTAVAGLGYGTGAGGTVTQATSRTNGVSISPAKPSGSITLFTAAGSATATTFTVTMATAILTLADCISLTVRSATNKYMAFASNITTTTFDITFYSISGTASDTPIINFNVHRGSTT